VRRMSYLFLSSDSVKGIMMRVGVGILYRTSLVFPYRYFGIGKGTGKGIDMVPSPTSLDSPRIESHF
jgi:hypothetical protein